MPCLGDFSGFHSKSNLFYGIIHIELWMVHSLLFTDIRSLPKLPSFHKKPENRDFLLYQPQKRKYTKDYVRKYKRIMQNKPNFQKSQMNVNLYNTTAYENKHDWTLGENKPNSNPIQANFNAYQTQFKPKQTQFQTAFFLQRYLSAPRTHTLQKLLRSFVTVHLGNQGLSKFHFNAPMLDYFDKIFPL